MKRSLLPICLLLTFSCGFFGAVSPVMAVEINVTTEGDDLSINGNCSLREAIKAANDNATIDNCVAGSDFEIDQIILGRGTFSISIVGSAEDDNLTGDFDVTDDTQIIGVSPGLTLLSGAGLDRVLEVHSGVIFQIENLTIEDGNVSGPGGGLYLKDLTDVDITNLRFQNNESSNFGGAIANNEGHLNITNSLFQANYAESYGGAISSYGVTPPFVEINSSTFSGNSIGIAGSSAGGAIEVNSGFATLNNLTVVNNTAEGDGQGGGIAVTGGNVGFRNTVFWGNNSVTSPNCVQTSGTLASNGYNFIADNTGCTYLTSSSDQVGTNVSPIDPQLIALSNNGGGTLTYGINLGSPLIDRGSPSPLDSGGDSCNLIDQRGLPRANDGDGISGGACDIGAVEYYLTTSSSFVSRKRQDGFIVEGSSSGIGARVISDKTLKVGDTASNRQLLSLLSFNTSLIPDSAVILSVELSLKRRAIRGINPVTTHGDLLLQIKNGFFGANARLKKNDFESLANDLQAGTLLEDSLLLGNYSGAIHDIDYSNINHTGTTQFRLAFASDDNDNGVADQLIFHGDTSARADRPVLQVTWVEP